ncbi:hypothetical protein ECANGB1_910 [Enterospora canceri]|uniref:Thioredoxin domain-containing protein n=1 Tax=Enterospora canceri TaxID=1081671 RepID=A0A1Y1S7Y4_9MICR|nr:hypothetical protein ECANGB1_910 [Enterospora canceri]
MLPALLVFKDPNMSETTNSIIYKNVSKPEELKNLGVNAVLIQLTAANCGSYKNLTQFINEYSTNKEIYVVLLDLSQTNELLKRIMIQFSVRRLPFLLYTTVDLEPIDMICGFNEEKVSNLLESYDKQFVPTPEF